MEYVDFMFLFDSSGTVGQSQFQKSKEASKVGSMFVLYGVKLAYKLSVMTIWGYGLWLQDILPFRQSGTIFVTFCLL